MNDRYTVKANCLGATIFLVGFFLNSAQGQFIANSSGIVEVDSSTNMLNKSLPFDQQFTLRLTYPHADPPASISIFKMDKYGSRLPTSKRDYMKHYRGTNSKPIKKIYKNKTDYRTANSLYRKYRHIYKSQHDPNFSFYTIYPKDFVKINSSKTSTTVTVNVPPLDPNRQYWFYLLRRDGSTINSTIKIAQWLNIGDRQKAEESYGALIKDRFDVLESSQLPRLDTLEQKFKESRLLITESDDNPNLTYLHELSIVPATMLGVINANSITLPAPGAKQAWPCCDKVYDFSTLKDIMGNPLSIGASYKLYRQSSTFIPNATTSIKRLTSENYMFDGHSLILNPGSSSSGIGVNIRRSPNSLAREISDAESSLRSIVLPTLNVSIVDIQKHLTNYKCEKSGNLNAVPFCENRNNLLQAISNLAKGTNFGLIAQGLLAINYSEPVTPVPSNEVQLRIDHIKSSLLLLEQLQQYVDYLIKAGTIAPTPGNFNSLVTDLNGCITNLNDGLNKLKNITSVKSEFVATLSREKVEISRSSSNDGTTDVFDFKTRSKFRIVPDFGLIGAFMNTPVDFRSGTSLAPYLGFHVNFRPINKDIPFRLIRYKTPAHRLSFMAGLTLTSIKSENQREDLFGSRSLVTGFGFRMSNAIKIAIGGLWYKALDTNPLLDAKRTSVAPYVGVSFDLEIRELLGGIIDLFK